MECNRDEAIRAKKIAERNFMARDYFGAKRFALKAQNLYPELEGLSPMLTTLDVYISAESRVSSGEVDWYSVLGVSPWADDEMVRKQYQKLALILHPDKNKSQGSDGAFKLVSEAWSVLSDKAKRLEYNKKLNMTGYQQGTPKQPEVPSQPPSVNGFHNLNGSQSKKTAAGQTSSPSPSPSHRKPDTFWTICTRCKTQYEYLRVYLNHTLLCPNCHEAFFAVEKAPPPNVIKPSNYSSHQKHKDSRHNVANNNQFNSGRTCGAAQSSVSEGFSRMNSSNHSDPQRNHFSAMAGARGTVSSPSISGQAASVVQQPHEQRDHLFKKRRSDETCMNHYGADKFNRMAMGSQGAGSRTASESRRFYSETEKIYGFSGVNSKPNAAKDLSPFEVRNLLIEKGRLVIRKGLEEWRSNQLKLKENKTKKNMVNDDKFGQKKNGNLAATNRGSRNKKSFHDFSPSVFNEEAPAPMPINVPDPDFHNFDLDRTESAFADDQVWAAYDENDGMPRYYARIHKVISFKPFKMKISWLNSRSNSEFGILDWVGSGFPKSCGDFRTGRHEISETLNSFSHKVRWTKGNRGVICILPRKGEIWALYRNWSAEWNERTPVEVVHKYDMVEVMDDYNEEQGIFVIPLVKVCGFKTVFHKHVDTNEIRRIPREGMFCFSHQVPYYLLTGEEAHNAPKGCLELDPAATPPELLQVITEANNKIRMVDRGGEAGEEMVQNISKVSVDQMVKSASKGKEGQMIEHDEQTEE